MQDKISDKEDACEKPEERCTDCGKILCGDVNDWKPDRCHKPHGNPCPAAPAPRPKDVTGWERTFRTEFCTGMDDHDDEDCRKCTMAIGFIRQELAQAEKSGFLRGLRVAEGAGPKKRHPTHYKASNPDDRWENVQRTEGYNEALDLKNAAIAEIIRDEEKKL